MQTKLEKMRVRSAELLKLSRERAGLDIGLVSKKLGISENALRSYERGDAAPPVGYLKAILDLYGVSGDVYLQAVLW